MDANDLAKADKTDAPKVFRSIVLANPDEYPNLSRDERRKNHWNFHHTPVDTVE